MGFPESQIDRPSDQLDYQLNNPYRRITEGGAILGYRNHALKEGSVIASMKGKAAKKNL